MKADETMMNYTAVKENQTFCGIEPVRMKVIKSEKGGLRGVFEKYRDCMLCTNNACNSDKSFVF